MDKYCNLLTTFVFMTYVLGGSFGIAYLASESIEGRVSGSSLLIGLGAFFLTPFMVALVGMVFSDLSKGSKTDSQQQ